MNLTIQEKKEYTSDRIRKFDLFVKDNEDHPPGLTFIDRRADKKYQKDYWLEKEAFARAYLENEKYPHFIRFARALVCMWLSAPVVIEPGSLLLGTCYIKQKINYDYARGLRFTPEEDLAEGSMADDLLKYYRKHYGNFVSHYIGRVPKDFLDSRKFNYPLSCLADYGSGTAHLTFNYASVLSRGLGGLNLKIGQELERSGSDEHKKEFLEAQKILCSGISAYILNYQSKALAEAAGENDPLRKKELGLLSGICGHIAQEAPAGFHEALQLVWFIHILDGFGYQTLSGDPGRFDQYLLPYYKKSIADGTLTAGLARDLIDTFWLKSPLFGCWNICLGGQTPAGDDACNELTELCLSATGRLFYSYPNLSFRWNKKTPDKIFHSVIKILSTGRALPAIYNDEIIIPSLQKIGVNLEDARNYAMGGCNNIHIHGRSHFGGPDVDLFNVVKPLEWVLFNGNCLYHNKMEGLETGPAASFGTFEDFKNAYKKQLLYSLKRTAQDCNILQEYRTHNFPHLYKSLFIDNCLDSGVSIEEGGAKYNGATFWLIGFANAADSLAAVKQAVFDEKKITMPELTEALKNNFRGYAELHAYLKNRCPKFGNNIRRVDELASELCEFCCSELKKIPAFRGGFFMGEVASLFRNIELGRQLSATPDGRLSGERLSSSIGPQDGKDNSGSTALLISAAKMPQIDIPGGAILNLRFVKSDLASDEKIEKFGNFIKQYFLMGGQQVQLTVVNADDLKKARVEPENYQDLLIKVGGYVARFIDLTAEQQESIIERNEISLSGNEYEKT